jgi:heterodisulfide reductase subunit D
MPVTTTGGRARAPNRSQIRHYEEKLKQIAGLRVSTRLVDRIAASGDASGLVVHHWRWKYLCLPDIVVSPNDITQLREAVALAVELRVPLVCRAGGTSYFGESVPALGGVLIDLRRMDETHVEPEARVVRFGPGAIFSRLMEELAACGLELFSHPSSYRGATIGGWFASGGIAGIGTAGAGRITEQITSVTVLTPEGTLETHSGQDLGKVFGQYGQTGILVEGALKVRPITPWQVAAALIAPESLVEVLTTVMEWNQGTHTPSVSIDTVEFFDQRYARTEVASPGVVLLVRASHGHSVLRDLALLGTILSPATANTLWEQSEARELRVAPLDDPAETRPITVSQQILCTTDQLRPILHKLEQLSRVAGIDAASGGHLNRYGQVRLHVEIPTGTDNWYHFLTSKGVLHRMVGTAIRAGAAPYSFGLQNAFWWHKWKRTNSPRGDPAGPQPIAHPLFNPLKRNSSKIRRSRVSVMFWLATRGYKLGATSSIETPNPVPGLTQCAFCQNCREVCPTYLATQSENYSAPGRIRLWRTLDREGASPDLALHESLFTCTSCRSCTEACPTGIPVHSIIEDLRTQYVQANCPQLPTHTQWVHSVRENGNPYNEPRTERLAWCGSATLTQSSAAFFVGCTMSYRDHEGARAAYQILQKLVPGGVVLLGSEEMCCGSPLLRTGQGIDPLLHQIVQHNVEVLTKRGITTLICSCAGCYTTITRDWPRILQAPLPFETRHLLEVLAVSALEQPSGAPAISITYHDPCHLGRDGVFAGLAREIFGQLECVELREMDHHGHNTVCCGAGGGVKAGYPEMSAKLGATRIGEAERTGAKYLVTACPFCKRNLRDAANSNDRTSQTQIRVLLVEELLHQIQDRSE